MSAESCRTGKSYPNTTTRSYDVFDRLASEIDRYGSQLQFVYDLNGNRLSRIDTSGTTSTVPDALNRIVQVTPPNSGTTQTVYTSAGRVASVTTPSGLVSSTSYDQAGRIVTLTHKQNAAPVASYAYGYDTNGNRVEQDETNGGLTEVTTYAYDDADRLTDVTYPDRTAHYDLDGVGNRTQETQTDASSHAQIRQVTATFNARDQLTNLADTSAATITYSYDANGNISTKSQSGQVTNYRNNTQDRLATLSLQGAPPSQASSYDYDASGMRVAKTTNGNTTHYRYDQQSLIQETNTLGNLLARYDYSADRQLAEVRNSNTNYFLHDALKSPIAQVTSQGAIAMRAQYDAWGLLRNESGTNTQAFGFTGYQRDRESGLYYAKARYYDPATARFNSQDPEEGNAQTPPSLHRYLYAYANPTVYVDHSGHTAEVAAIQWMLDAERRASVEGYAAAKADAQRAAWYDVPAAVTVSTRMLAHGSSAAALGVGELVFGGGNLIANTLIAGADKIGASNYVPGLDSAAAQSGSELDEMFAHVFPAAMAAQENPDVAAGHAVYAGTVEPAIKAWNGDPEAQIQVAQMVNPLQFGKGMLKGVAGSEKDVVSRVIRDGTETLEARQPIGVPEPVIITAGDGAQLGKQPIIDAGKVEQEQLTVPIEKLPIIIGENMERVKSLIP